MDADQNDIDLIENYLLGKLTEAEVRIVETRIDDDHEFARKYRLRKTFPSMMSEAGKREYDKKMAALPVPETEVKRFHLPKMRSWAWALLGIIVIGTVLLFFILKPSGKEVVEAKVDVAPVKEAPKVLKPGEPEKITALPSVDKPFASATEPIELLNPADGRNFSRTGDILFNWKQETDSFTRFFIYAETRDQLILWRGIRPGVRQYTVKATDLSPGKFYWFVGTKELKRTFVVTE